MRFFEFTQSSQPNTSNQMAELEYVLDHVPIDPVVLKKVKDFAKSRAKQKTTKVVTPAKPVPAQQPQTVTPTQPQTTEPPVKESVENDIDEILDVLSNNSDPQLITQILHTIKKNGYRNLIDQVIKQKFQSGDKAIATIKDHIIKTIDSISETVSVKEMIDFLNACASGGVIDCSSMIQSEQGTLVQRQPIPLSNESYRKFVGPLMNISVSGGAAGGRGEIGLAFAGIGASKGAKDLTINGTDIEVKASAQTTDFWLKGTKGFSKDKPTQAAAHFLNKLNTVGGKFTLSQIKDEGGMAQLTADKLPIVNPLFQRLGQAETQKLLKETIKILHSKTDISQFDSDIDASVAEDGTLDIRKLELAVGKIAFYYYQKMENHPGVLMLNVSDLTYTYIKSPEDMVTAIQSLGLQSTGVINFRPNSEGSTTWKLARMGTKRRTVKNPQQQKLAL